MPPPLQHPLPFRLLPTRASACAPPAGGPTLNVRLDGCIVPSEASPEGGRISYSQLVVLDDFVDDATRQELLDFLTGPGPGGEEGTEDGAGPSVPSMPPPAADAGSPAGDGPAAAVQEAAGEPQLGPAGASAVVASSAPASQPQLPASKWERRTTDMAGAAPSWGVQPRVLDALARMELPAMREVHTRLAALLPGYDIALLPSDLIQGGPAGRQGAGGEEEFGQGQHGDPQLQLQREQEQQAAGAPPSPSPCGPQQQQPQQPQQQSAQPQQQPRVDCNAFVANAAVAGDSFAWHVDADPTSFPGPSPWLDAYGDYFNGEPGKPLLASLMLYLNPEWRREWGAETLFLDAATECGVFVLPRPRRAVLFHQDVLHRVSPPSAAAGGRPRFSLVWKLALLPRVQPPQQQQGQGAGDEGATARAAAPAPAGIAPLEWAGAPASFGSAAKVDAVMRQLGAQLAGRGKRRHAEQA